MFKVLKTNKGTDIMINRAFYTVQYTEKSSHIYFYYIHFMHKTYFCKIIHRRQNFLVCVLDHVFVMYITSTDVIKKYNLTAYKTAFVFYQN